MNEDDYMMEEPPLPAAASGKPRPKRAVPASGGGGHVIAPPASQTSPAKGGKKGTNKRLGRLKKTEADEPAQFEPGQAAASKLFEPEQLAAELRIYWENDGGDSFILQVEDELWSRWPKAALVAEIKERLQGRVWHEKRAGEQLSEMERLLLYVRKHRCLHRMVNALAGYRSGHYDKHGRPFDAEKSKQGGAFIVGSSPEIIKPVKRDWRLLREFIEVRLKRLSPPYQTWVDASQAGPSTYVMPVTQDQALMFHLWCKNSYESLAFGEPGSYMGAHLLVLAGADDCGKSRLQTNVITPLLGGRHADPTSYLTGEDSFNADMVEAEHQQMEELMSGSQKTTDRVELSEAFKRMVATDSKRVRLMRNDPFTIEPFWRTTLSMNSDPDKMRAFPMLTPDFRGKVLMLNVDQIPLPLPTDTPAERKVWNERMREELPGYIYWLLNEFEVPEALLVSDTGKRETRFGFRAWQHPSLASALFDDSPGAQLLALIDACEITRDTSTPSMPCKLWELKGPHYNLSGRQQRGGGWLPVEGVWVGSAMDLEKWLSGEMEGWKSSVTKEALKLFRHTAVERVLSRLKVDCVDRVAQERKNTGRLWSIARPSGEE